MIDLYLGDCIQEMKRLSESSFSLIYADPPYNLSGKSFVTVQNGRPVRCDKGDWDIIDNLHEFNLAWIAECVRLLAGNGTIWISGTLHNHPSVGMALKELGLWIINDVVWFKRNATPMMAKNRFAPSTELIWVAAKSKKYYFDYDTAKRINGGRQMRNLWEINAERHKTKHPAEKPETLLSRIIQIGSKPGDYVLDPFMGSGTTGVVAQNMDRHFVGIEADPDYFRIASDRIEQPMQPRLGQPQAVYNVREIP